MNSTECIPMEAVLKMASAMTTSITENNLTELKNNLDNSASAIHELQLAENGIVYSYDTQFQASIL